MTEIEKDIFIIAAIGNLLKEEGKSLKDVLPELSGRKLKAYANTLNAFKTDEATDQAVIELAKECYERIKIYL